MNGQSGLLLSARTISRLFVTVGLVASVHGQTPSTPASAYLNLPLSFERQGTATHERFITQGQGYAIALEKGHALIGFGAATKNRKTSEKLISIDFAGGREAAATPADPLPGKVNRYSGSDPGSWQTGLPTFGKVSYQDVYPGVDVVYYGNQKQLEFDFIVKPGADPRAIRMKIGGADKLAIDASGALVLDGGHALKIALPAVYQEHSGLRKKIAGRYELRAGNEVAFAVDSWDHTRPLVIDPTLVYSGLIGGGTSYSTGYGIALDATGNIYIAGNTYATDFPSVSAAQSAPSLAGDGFVMKINAAGTALIYSTYLGGSGYDALQAIAVDSNGSAWVAGQTQSSDFPTVSPLQSKYGGNTDAVVAKFSSSGTLQFSTYIGGSGYDNAHSVAVDSSNAAYVAGETMSSSFPTSTGALLTAPAGQENAFAIKFNTDSSRAYSTLLGGASYDGAYGIAVDSSGSAYLTGFTSSSSFSGAPAGGAQTSNGGAQDVFAAKLNPAGSALLYFTFLGGKGMDTGQAIALDSSNNAYVAGSTTSPGLATQGASQTSLASGSDGFVAKLNAAGSAFNYVSYLGGNRQDYATGLAVDSSGNAYVGGYTDSSSFPAIAALQPNFPGNPISLFLTSNKGAAWGALDGGINGAVMDVSADPATSGTIVAATENGIFRTTNSGTSWTQALPLVYVASLARSPATGTTMYALAPNDVYLSSDNGVTWQYEGTLSSGNFEGLVADVKTATTVYAYSQDSGVYVSTNAGGTWTAANSGLPSSSVPALVAASDGTLYASVPGYGIYKSTNGASSWSAVNTGLPAGGAFYAHSLAVSGTTVYAASGTLYLTTNGGANWTTATGSVPGGSYVIGVSPSNAAVVFATAYGGGVNVSSDSGATWTAANSGISNLAQITEFAFDPLNGSSAFVVAPVSQVGFVAKLNPAGSALAYSSWFGAAGGNSFTAIYGLAANSSGDIFVTGDSSTDTGGAFPSTTTAFQGASYGAFVSRISAGTANCAVGLGPAAQTVSGSAQTLGLGAIAPSGCAWNATVDSNDQSWATITRGSTDIGIDAVTVQLAANTTGAARTATISAGGSSATITQADSGCAYTLSPSNVNVPAAGGTAIVGLTTAAGCPWSVTNTFPSAVTITSGASGTGNGTIALSVAPNAGLNSENFYLTVGTAQLSISQAGSCTYTFNPTSASLNASGGTGSFSVTAGGGSCSWFAAASDSWITLTGSASGTGNGTVNYSVAANSGALRNGSINVGGYSFAVTEAGVSGIATTTSLASSLNPSVYGQSVILTATVTSSSATGSVSFMDGSAVLGTVALSSGSALFSTTALSAGTHSLTAIYTGNSAYSGSTSAALSQVVGKVTTNTGLSSSPNPSAVGQSVTFTASVSPSAATGTVTFTDGSVLLGSIAVSNGSAVLTTATLTLGTHSVTASYSGDSNDTGSSSSAVSEVVGKVTTSTSLSSSPNPSAIAQSVTFTARVSPSSATGTIIFSDGSTSLGSSALSGGMAILTISSLTAGSHSITAAYGGDANDTSSSSSVVTQVVGKSATTTGLASSPNPSTFGQSVSLTATVSPASATGTVNFSDGSTALGSSPVSNGSAVFATSALTVGSHSVTAVYSGDSANAGSSSSAVSQVVGKVTTTTGLTASPNPSATGQSVAFTATVSPASATGTVTFTDGSTTLGSASLSNGSAVLNTTSLTSGSHSVTAVYGGDANDSGSASAAVSQTVGGGTSSTVITSSLNPSSFGQNVVFTATVTPASATGLVNFLDGSTMLGSGMLTSGAATFATAGLTAGSHSVTASYVGGTGVSPSVSAALTQTVNLAATTISLSSSPNPATSGQSITLNATVTPAGATGTVSFKDGLTTLGVASLVQGKASMSLTLNTGSHNLTAVYSGDANNAVSTSSVVNQTVSFPTLSITTSSLPQGMLGQSYGPVQFSASGGSGSYSWSAGGLPAGLGLTSGGSLSGTPSSTFNGSVGVTVSDTQSSATATAALGLSIVATPLTISGPSTLGSVVAGAAVSASFSASGGLSPYTWAISGISGLSIDSSGHVSGTAGSPGSYSAQVTVTDSLNTSTSKSATLSSFGITSGSLPPGSTSAPYSATITAAGGTPPYLFTASGLPPGVTFSGGAFGGTPTTAGSYSVSVHAGDSGGLSVSASYSITITSGATPLSVFTSSLSDAISGQSYSGSVSAAGGATPYTWSQSGGVLPAGMSFSSAGQVTGTANVPGAYTIGVKVTDGSGAFAVGSVSLNVDPAPVQVTNGAAFPSAIAGSDYPAQALMASGGVAPYTFSINGSLPAGLSLSGGQIAGIPQSAGSYSFTVKAVDSSTPPLSGLLGAGLNVRPQSADLVLAASSVAFSIAQGTSAVPSANTVGVASSVVSQSISFSTSASASWLSATGGSTTPGVISIALTSAALSLTASGGPYSATVTVTCNSGTCSGTSQTIAVSLAVTSSAPLLSAGSGLISFAALASNPQAQTASLPITNAGGGSLVINSANSSSPWLTVSAPPASIAPGPGANLTVTADSTGLSTGYYRGSITISSSGGSATVAVTLFVSGAATISLGPSGSQFSLPQGGVLGLNTGSFSVDASNGASLPFTASVSGASWLTLSNPSGTAATGVPATGGYTIDPNAASTFAAGSYYGTIQVSATGAANSPQSFIVVLNVTSATAAVIPDLQPAGLVFVSAAGSALPAQTVNVYASSRTPLTFQASASSDFGSWLSVSPSTGSASGGTPGSVSVSASPTGLTAGAYRGQVSFAFGSSVRSVNVTLIVEPQGSHSISSTAPKPLDNTPLCSNAQLVPTQTALVNNFSVPTAWPTPLTIQLFDTCGSIVGNAQIVATFTNGDPPLALTTVSSASGTYSATWTPRKASAQVTVTASVSASGYPGAQVKISGQSPANSAPILAPNGAGDVFNPQVGAGLGPGNIIQVYGSGLATLTTTPAVLPLPTLVTGTSVIIGGVQAPLFYVSPTQINAQIPFTLSPGNQYQLLVSANGALTTPLSLQLNAGAPAVLNFSSGAVVAQHLDGTLVLPAAPAVQGEYIVIYSSGLGATDIPVASGAASPTSPLANVANPPVLTLNGNTTDILFAGLTPGLVGLYQVNFQVPATLTPGNYNLVLTQGGTASNTTLLPVAAAPSQ